MGGEGMVAKAKKLSQIILNLQQKRQGRMHVHPNVRLLQKVRVQFNTHFVQLHNKVNYRDVGALHWISETCVSAFCGSPNYPVFGQKLFITCCYFNKLHTFRNVGYGEPRPK